MTRPSISLVMIVRNEADVLEQCINSARPFVDEIAVADTGSVDGSAALAEKLGARVEKVRWQDDYSAARNAALSLAACDWVLVLDADEKLAEGAGEALVQAASGAGDAFCPLFHNFTGDGLDGPVFFHRVCRIFRNHRNYRFTGRIHECVEPSILSEGGKILDLDSCVIHHFGYQPHRKQQKHKVARYARLLNLELRDRPGDPRVLFQLGAVWQQSDPSRAAVYFKQAAEGVTGSGDFFGPMAYSGLAACLISSGRAGEALQALDRAHEAGLSHPELLQKRSAALLALGRSKAAARAASEGAELGRSGIWMGESRAFGWQADAYAAALLYDCGDIEAAERHADLALESSADNIEMLEIAARSSFSLGRPAESSKWWGKICELRPDDAGAHLELGSALHRAGDVEHALEALTRSITLEPGRSDAYFKAAEVLVDAGAPDDAVEVCLAGLRVDAGSRRGQEILQKVRQATSAAA